MGEKIASQNCSRRADKTPMKSLKSCASEFSRPDASRAVEVKLAVCSPSEISRVWQYGMHANQFIEHKITNRDENFNHNGLPCRENPRYIFTIAFYFKVLLGPHRIYNNVSSRARCVLSRSSLLKFILPIFYSAHVLRCAFGTSVTMC